MKKSNILLLALLIVTLLIIVAGVVFMKIQFNVSVLQGEGPRKEANRELADFSKIKINGKYNVYFTQDSITSLVLTADENLHEFIRTDVRNDELIIEATQSIRSRNEMQIMLSGPYLSRVEAMAAAGFYTQNQLTVDKLEIHALASAIMEIHGIFETLIVRQSAGSRIQLEGKTETLDVQSNAGGTVDAFNLESEVARAEANAGASINVNARQLRAKANAGGVVNYTGNPTVLEMESNAGGRVRARQ